MKNTTIFFLTSVYALCFLVLPNSSNAEDFKPKSISVEAEPIIIKARKEVVVVTAQRIPKPKSRTVENVSVYTEEDIEKLPARDLGELLQYIPGVNISARSQFGQATALSINGAESRQVLLMVDGVPFNTQLSGQANPARLPLENIKQIEVVKGASSSAWGSSLGGVINVITKDVGTTTRPKMTLTSSFAEFSTTKNSLDMSGAVSDLGYFLSGSFFETDGILNESRSDSTHTFAKLSHPIGDEAKVTGSFGYSGGNVRFGVTRANRINSQPFISRYGKFLFDIEKDTFNFNAAYKYNDQDITTDIYNSITSAQVSSTVSQNVYHGISLVGSVPFRDEDTLVFGSDFDWHTFKSNSFLTSSKKISMQSPYINYTLVEGDWEVIPGIRFDNNQRFGSQVSPSLGGIYHVPNMNKTLIRAKVSQAFNAPPLLWIFNDDPTVLTAPNPDLQAETAFVYEAGFETRPMENLTFEFNVYRSDVKDAIITIFSTKQSAFLKDNVRKLVRQGGEIIVNYDLNDEISLFMSGAFNDIENKDGNDKLRDETVARQAYKVGTNYKNKHGFGVNLQGYYNQWLSGLTVNANDRKFLFDVKIIQEFKNIRDDVDLELFLNIYNVTSSSYWSNITFPAPERYFEGGFELVF